MSGLYDSVVVSTRIRLARNFVDYPFPNRLKDERAAFEIVKLIAAELNHTDEFTLYFMNDISTEQAEFLKERHLISQALIDRRHISAALVSKDESISVMINEEDHIREQYFLNGFNLKSAYERIAGIDDIISSSIPFAYDEKLGYLTACPTNLGTGLRASVMLFLPALTRRRLMRDLVPALSQNGLTVRGAYGEGSGTDGELYQVSNEITLGYSEINILKMVESNVKLITEFEIRERQKLYEEDEIGFADRVYRSYGILTNCKRLDEREFMCLMADVKLGVAMGLFKGNMQELNDLSVAMRPANINRLNGSPLKEEGIKLYRAEYAGKAIRAMRLI